MISADTINASVAKELHRISETALTSSISELIGSGTVLTLVDVPVVYPIWFRRTSTEASPLGLQRTAQLLVRAGFGASRICQDLYCSSDVHPGPPNGHVSTARDEGTLSLLKISVGRTCGEHADTEAKSQSRCTHRLQKLRLLPWGKYCAGHRLHNAHMLKTIHAAAITLLLLTGCASMQESTPIQADMASRGSVLKRLMPTPLPSGAVAIPGLQFIIVNADSAAMELVGMLNPIPFVTDAAQEGLRHQEAEGYRDRYATVDPFAIASARMAGSSVLSTRADALPLMPFVYMVQGSDGRWRLSLTFRAEGAGWVGRYMYHLPTTYDGGALQQADTQLLALLRQELTVGSDVLRTLMERDFRGELRGDGRRVEFGSYYVVGSDLLGMVPARLVRYADAELIEEGPEHVVLRSRGDLHADAASGALAYGVHYFRKDQLHDFKKEPARLN